MSIFIFSPVFSQETGEFLSVATESQYLDEKEPDDMGESEESEEYEDFDSLFDEAEDSEEAVITKEEKAGTDYALQFGSLKLPFEFSGKMNAEVGGAYIREKDKNDASVYFDFKNYIYFTMHPDKYLALKAVLKTSLPDDSNDFEGQQYLYVYEIYFEYLMFGRVYFTAGKKSSVWGNVRLFSNGDDYSDEEALCTNLLYDSRRQLSGIIKVPFWNHTFTAVAMYNGTSSSGNTVGSKDMSFAASLELVFFNTFFNIFGRRYPMSYGEKSEQHKPTIGGIEIKRTLFGVDVYGQMLGRVISGWSALENIFSSDFTDLSYFEKIIMTGGLYRVWTDNAPHVGFNFEYQTIYHPNAEEDERDFTNRFAFYFGMSKLGPGKNIKFGVHWNHNISEKSGVVEPGLVFSRVMPHCDWKYGVKYEYDSNSTSFDTYKLTVGTYLNISLDY